MDSNVRCHTSDVVVVVSCKRSKLVSRIRGTVPTLQITTVGDSDTGRHALILN
jgi:hypothetical protein